MKRSHIVFSLMPAAWVFFIIISQLQFYADITSDSAMPPDPADSGDPGLGTEQLCGISSPAPAVPFQSISFCPDPIPLDADTLATIFAGLPLPTMYSEILYPYPSRNRGRDIMLTRMYAGVDPGGHAPGLIGCLTIWFYLFPRDSVRYQWRINVHVLKWRAPIAVSHPVTTRRSTVTALYDSVQSGTAGCLKYRTTRMRPDTSCSYLCLWNEGPWLTEVTVTNVPPAEQEKAKILFDSLIGRISRYYRDLNRQYAEGSL